MNPASPDFAPDPRSWSADPEHILQVLQQDRRERVRCPNLPGYDDLRELGRGGQGIVYAATQRSTRRRVAVKVLLDGIYASAASRRRFERELDLIVALRHPNIVQVYDCGVTPDDHPCLIMEYVDGVPLDLWARTPLKSPDRILPLFAEICDAVSFAHQHGVIHRDLKPSNIFIDADGRPRLLDFGLARSLDAAPAGASLTGQGHFFGSLPWASPEQAEGSPRLIDTRSDVYSLGIILYQLLTADFPYSVDGSLRQTLHNIQHAPPRPPRELSRSLSDEVATIVLKCLAKEPERRYQSAGDLARDIRRHLAGEPIEAKRDSAWYAVRKTVNRYRTAVRAVSVLLIASLLFSAAMVRLRARAVAAERLAENRLEETQAAHQAQLDANAALATQVARNDQVREFLDTTLRAVDPWKHSGRDIGPLRELLDSAVQRLDAAFPDQPQVEAAIAGTLGADYRALGLFDEAERLLRRSYDQLRRTLGPAHRDTMAAMNNFATLMTDRGRHAEAAALFEQLHALQQQALGPEHPDTLESLSNLALDLDWQGRSAEAEVLYRRALEAQTRLLGPEHPARLHTLNNLALCLPALGKLDEAEGLQRELVDIRTAVFGAEHPETLQVRMNLAGLLIQRGRLADAEDLLREVLALLESALTPNHPLTITALHNLADVVSNRGRLDEGLALARRAYDAQVAFAGSEHPTTLASKNELACALIEMKRWDEAIPLATELREQYVRLLGPGDWRTLNAGGNLAFALNQMGQVDEAERLWRSVIADADLQLEATAAPAASAHANLAALLADRQRWPEAEAEFRMAIDMQEQLGQADHWRTAYIRAGLGRVLLETNRADDARALLEPAWNSLRDALGDDHEKTRRTREWLDRLHANTADAAATAAAPTP